MSDFHTETWLNNLVRTSAYNYPTAEPDYGNDTLDAKSMASALLAVTQHDSDIGSGCSVLPPRCPMDVPLPNALATQFEAVVSHLAKKANRLHPAAVHALLAVALRGDDLAQRDARMDSLKPLFESNSNTPMWQPTLTWAAFLRPDWFASTQTVRAHIRGAAPRDAQKGQLSSVNLTLGKMRVNPAEFFSSAKVVTPATGLIPENKAAWEEDAYAAFHGNHALPISLWLMAFGDKELFWPFLPPGAAMYSPFYTDGEVDALLHNAVAVHGQGFYTRLGAGIADIYPFDKDTALSALVDLKPIMEAPLSYATLLTMLHLAQSTQSPFRVDPAWAQEQLTRIAMAESLGLLPIYSAFYSTDGAMPPAQRLLQAMATGSPERMLPLLRQMGSILEQHQVGRPEDCGTIGFSLLSRKAFSDNNARSHHPATTQPSVGVSA